MIDILRSVTTVEVDGPLCRAAIAEGKPYLSVVPLQTVLLTLKTTLPKKSELSPLARQLALEVGEHDPQVAWKKLMAAITVVPVVTTGDDASSSLPTGPSHNDADISRFTVQPSPIGNAPSNNSMSQMPPLLGSHGAHATIVRNGEYEALDGIADDTPEGCCFRYNFRLTMPNAPDGGGSIAVRIDLQRNPSSLAEAVAVPVGTLYFGTVITRVQLQSTLSVRCDSRCIAPNLTQVLVTVGNVSRKNISIKSVEFDALSTRVGSFRDSLDVMDRHPCHRIAPKYMDSSHIKLLLASITVIPLPVHETNPSLQPLETFSYQFSIRLKPHLEYLLTGAICGCLPSSPLDANPSGVNSGNEKLLSILAEKFESAVHIQFLQDEFGESGEASRFEAVVPWAIGRRV